MRKPLSAPVPDAQPFGTAGAVASDNPIPMFGLQGAFFCAHNRLVRPFVRQVPALPSHGPEWLDGKDVYGSAVLGSRQGGTGGQKTQVRVLSPQLCQFPAA